MSSATIIYTGGLIFDGHQLLRNYSAVFSNNTCTSLIPDAELCQSSTVIELNGDILSAGYADLQVNGGGGILFNDDPSIATLTTIADAHNTMGTTHLLPTLITDAPQITEAAIEATIEATTAAAHSRLGAIVGLHLEGPHISIEKKGAHDANLIRPMQPGDLNLLLQAAQHLPILQVTLAPENVSIKQVQALAEAGIIVALGHTNADYKTCIAYHQAGARCVTHLFNAMSQLGSREPGLVGAAFDTDELSVGLIADGVHVHPASIKAAWKIKALAGRCYLVTDAMTPAGTTLDAFKLNGRNIKRQNGRLTLEDGTLAGADIELTHAIRFLCTEVGVDLEDALRAAIEVPRQVLGMDKAEASIVGQSAGRIIRISAALDKICYL